MTGQDVDFTTPAEQPRRRPRGRRMAFVTLLMAGAYVWAADLAVHGGDRWGIPWDGVLLIKKISVLFGAAELASTGEVDQPAAPMMGLPFFGPAGRSGPPRLTPEQKLARGQRQMRLGREAAAVEAVALGWEWVMRGFAAGLALIAVLSWITAWGRFWHLLGALAIFLMTAVTLVCTRYLDIPDGSDLSIWPLSAEQYTRVLDRLLIFGQEHGYARQLATLEALYERQGMKLTLPTGGGLGEPPLTAKSYVLIGAVFSIYGWILLLVFARRSRRPKPAHPPA